MLHHIANGCILKICVVIVLVFSFVQEIKCDNTTDKYLTVDYVKLERNARLLTFNTTPDGAVNVELAFNVPFLQIPVKRAMSGLYGGLTGFATANINVGAVVLAGAMIFGAAIVIPVALHYVTKTVGIGYRSSEYETNNMWRILSSIENVLLENNVDTTSCMQRAVCWSVKNSAKEVQSGHGSSSDKIIDGLATNDWLNTVLNGSALQSAIETGLKGINCSKKYSSCRITHRTVEIFMKKFVNSFKDNKK